MRSVLLCHVKLIIYLFIILFIYLFIYLFSRFLVMRFFLRFSFYEVQVLPSRGSRGLMVRESDL